MNNAEIIATGAQLLEAGVEIVREVMKDIADFHAGKITADVVRARQADHKALIKSNRAAEDAEVTAQFDHGGET